MWRSFSAFPQLFKNHIKKEEGREPSCILGFQPKTMCKEMNSSTMLKWGEVKDCNGTNLHLFDAVQVITSDNRHNNQTGRILSLAFRIGKGYSPMSKFGTHMFFRIQHHFKLFDHFVKKFRLQAA